MRGDFSLLFASQLISILCLQRKVRSQNFKRENQSVSYANFVKNPFSRLNSSVLAVVSVSYVDECALHCIKNQHCWSVNVGASHEGSKLLCELIHSDRFKEPNEFLSTSSFHHYSIKTPCMSDPCKNGALCQPIYHLNDYQCACAAGFTGQDCETVNWVQMTPSSVCVGTRDDSPGYFRVPLSGEIITFKLTYQSGSILCAFPHNTYFSHWGCRYGPLPFYNKTIGIHITDDNMNRLLPDNSWLVDNGVCWEKYFYNLPWMSDPDSPELLFDNFSTPLSVSAEQQFQIWFAEDIDDCVEEDNDGQTCAKVYALFV